MVKQFAVKPVCASFSRCASSLMVESVSVYVLEKAVWSYDLASGCILCCFRNNLLPRGVKHRACLLTSNCQQNSSPQDISRSASVQMFFFLTKTKRTRISTNAILYCPPTSTMYTPRCTCGRSCHATRRTRVLAYTERDVEGEKYRLVPVTLSPKRDRARWLLGAQWLPFFFRTRTSVRLSKLIKLECFVLLQHARRS